MMYCFDSLLPADAKHPLIHHSAAFSPATHCMQGVAGIWHIIFKGRPLFGTAVANKRYTHETPHARGVEQV
jgi:hypothetical protein